MIICDEKTDLLPCELFCPHTKREGENLLIISCPFAGNDDALKAVARKGWCSFNPAKRAEVDERKSMGWKKSRNK